MIDKLRLTKYNDGDITNIAHKHILEMYTDIDTLNLNINAIDVYYAVMFELADLEPLRMLGWDWDNNTPLTNN